MVEKMRLSRKMQRKIPTTRLIARRVSIQTEIAEIVLTESESPKSKVAKKSTLVDWLLSDEAFDMAHPEIPQGHGEVDWTDGPHKKTPPPPSSASEEADDRRKEDNIEILRYPRSPLTPFQNLVAASLLSKPFSHRLGLRTIQTLLNPPFGLRTVSDLDEAGYEGRRKVMWEARTQHKEKTAAQLGDLVEGVKELCGDHEEDLSELKGLKGMLDGLDPQEAQTKVEETLTKIKGIGPGVVGIFLRRIQGDWSEVFPYADDKSLAAARHFGILGEQDGVAALAEKVDGDRGRLVRLLDTLIGLELEKVMDKAVDRAGK